MWAGIVALENMQYYLKCIHVKEFDIYTNDTLF